MCAVDVNLRMTAGIDGTPKGVKMDTIYILKMDCFDWPHDTIEIGAYKCKSKAEADLKEYKDAQDEPDENGYVSECKDYYYITEMRVK